MTELHGRGAWSVAGVGGTLAVDGTRPGPYYCLNDGMLPVGFGTGWDEPDPNRRAVYAGVLAIQRALNRRKTSVDTLLLDGLFGPRTKVAVVQFQRRRMPGESDWGGVGPETAQALFDPDIRRVCADEAFARADVVCGVLKSESAFDPGAVGYTDPSDLGLAQINGPSHPDLTEKQRLQPITAIGFVVSYLRTALAEFDDDLDASIASYNLGLGGARSWIRDGRPDVWTLAGSTTPRDVAGYIDRIKSGCAS